MDSRGDGGIIQMKGGGWCPILGSIVPDAGAWKKYRREMVSHDVNMGKRSSVFA